MVNTEEFKKACEPLMRYLADNCHPHVKVIVTSDVSELMEGIATCNTLFEGTVVLANPPEYLIECEIEDLETGCTYIRTGTSVTDCVAQFQAFFMAPHKNKVLWQRPILKEVKQWQTHPKTYATIVE